jgi:hypothetical protein
MWQVSAAEQNSKGTNRPPAVATFHGACQEMIGQKPEMEAQDAG